MTDTQDIIDDIVHATRYDPVYAREYYLRNRELKGRRSTSGLKTDKQKIGWQYVKSEVTKERKTALDAARDKKSKDVEQLRDNAEKRREVIREKLRAIMASISKKTTAAREDISEDVQAQIDKLPPIPKGVPAWKAAELATERREKIEKIRGDAQADRKKLSGDTRTARIKERESSTRDRATVRTQLTASIEKARKNYNTSKEAIKAKYEGELDAEYETIKNTVR